MHRMQRIGGGGDVEDKTYGMWHLNGYRELCVACASVELEGDGLSAG